MAKYGLQRGIRGSDARHITTGEYYRNVFEKAEIVKEEVGVLQQQEKEQQARLAALQAETIRKEAEVKEKEKQLREVKNQVVQVGFEKSAKETGKNVLEGIGALMGNPKAKKLEAEIDVLKNNIRHMETEKENIEKEAKSIIAQKNQEITQKDELINSQQSKMDRLFESMPILKDFEFIVRLCETIKVPLQIVKQILSGQKVAYSGELYSPEHKQNFEAKEAVVSIARDKEKKPCLAIDGIYYVDWFKLQKQKFLESLGIKINETRRSRGIR